MKFNIIEKNLSEKKKKTFWICQRTRINKRKIIRVNINYESYIHLSRESIYVLKLHRLQIVIRNCSYFFISFLSIYLDDKYLSNKRRRIIISVNEKKILKIRQNDFSRYLYLIIAKKTIWIALSHPRCFLTLAAIYYHFSEFLCTLFIFYSLHTLAFFLLSFFEKNFCIIKISNGRRATAR